MESAEGKDRHDTITFVIFTFNEEKRIEWAIRNFLGWGRILIVDNFSEDKTVEIAKSFGCDVLLNKNQGWVEDFATTERVKAAVQTEWIYWGFADEIVTSDTLTAIYTAINKGRFEIINLARKNYFYGQFCYGALAHKMHRVFKKSAIDFRGNKIHQFGRVAVSQDAICYLDNARYFVHHLISNDSSSYLRSMDRYTSLELTSAPVSQHHGSYWLHALKQVLIPIKVIIGNFILRQGFRGGRSTLYLLLDHVFYHWLLAMKQYEFARSLSPQGIEELNDQTRSRLLSAASGSNQRN